MDVGERDVKITKLEYKRKDKEDGYVGGGGLGVFLYPRRVIVSDRSWITNGLTLGHPNT